MPFIDLFPEPTPTPATASLLHFAFDILPNDLVAKMRELWPPRVKVDGTEVRINQAQMSDEASATAISVNVELTNPADHELFTPTASIDFGVGRRIVSGGGWDWDEATFIHLIDGGRAPNVSRTIEGPPLAMADKSSVTILSPAGVKLNKTSETGLIVYDSNRVTINADDVETIYDKAGHPYAPERMAVPGLTLQSLFQEVLVTKCGFTAVHTDLPAADYPIQRYEVSMGERFYDGLKKSIGMYSPAIKPYPDGSIGIYDTTTPYSEALNPGLRRITVDRSKSINLDRNQKRIDALLLHFVGLANNYDYTTFKFDYPTDTVGSAIVDTERISVEFRKITSPTTNVIVRTALNIENKVTRKGGTVIDETSDVYEFTASGQYAHRAKTTKKLLPPISNVTLPPTLQNYSQETEENQWLPHPFRRRLEYIAQRETRTTAVVLTDSDNPLPDGSAWKRDLATGHRFGNVLDGQTFTTEEIKAGSESAEPLRNGMIRVRVFEVDSITGLVIRDYTEDRPGEAGVSGVASSRLTMPVFAEDNPTRSLDYTDELDVGELPLRYALPLAKRVLIQRQTADEPTKLNHVGFDPSLVKSILIAPDDRDGNPLGNYIIRGRTANFTQEGAFMQLSCDKVANTDLPLNELPSIPRTINSGEALIFEVPIACLAGYSLISDVVADLTVEARHKETPNLPWEDIELGEVDLTVFDGTTESFQIRVTAGAVTEITHREFDVSTDLISRPGPVDIEYLNGGSASDSGTFTTSSHTVHINSGANRLFIIGIGNRNAGVPTAVTLNGSSLTLVGASPGQIGTRTSVWFLINPTAGDHSLQIDWATSQDDVAFVYSVLANVDQTTTIEIFAAESGVTPADANLDVSSFTARMIMDFLTQWGPIIGPTDAIPAAPQILREHITNPITDVQRIFSSTILQGESAAMAWNVATGGNFSHIAVSIIKSP